MLRLPPILAVFAVLAVLLAACRPALAADEADAPSSKADAPSSKADAPSSKADVLPTEPFERGVALFGKGLYAPAADSFAQYIAARPTGKYAARAALMLAESRLYLGRYTEAARALDWIEASRWSDRLEADVEYWRARLALETGDTSEAIKALTGFLAEHPRHALAQYARLSLGQAQLAAGRPDEATAMFDAVITAAPKTSPLPPAQAEALFLAALGKGRCLVERDKPDEARTLVLAAMEKLAAREAVRLEAFVVLGEASYRAKKYAEALEYFKRSYKEDFVFPWYPEALYGIAWCHIELGAYDTARTVLADAVTDYPRDAVAPRLALSLAKLDLLEQHGDDAAKRLRALLEAEPPAPIAEEAAFLAGDALLTAGAVDDAAAEYDAYLKRYAQGRFTSKAQYGLAIARLRQGRTDEGLALLDTVGGGEDRVLGEQALRRLAQELFDAGRFQEAIERYSQLLGPDPPPAGADRLQETIERYRKVLDRNPAPADADRLLFQLAWCYYKTASYDWAIALFGLVVEKCPKSDLADNAQYRIGGAFYRQGRPAAAIEAYEAFAKRFPESELADRAAYQLGLCRYNSGDYPAALLAYKQVVDKYPTSTLVPRADYEIGWCHTMLGKNDEAFNHFTEYVKKYADSALAPEVVFWLGEHHYNRAEYAKALDRFEQVGADYAEHELAAAALYWAGRSCLNLKQYEKAQERFAAVVAAARVDAAGARDFAADAQYQTAVCLIEQGEHEQAVDVLTPLAAAPDEPGARYLLDKVRWRLAECHYALGDIDKAQPLFEGLATEARDETVRAWARYGLGRCFMARARAGAREDYDRAIEQFMTAAADYPFEPDVQGPSMVAAGRCYAAQGKHNEASILYASVVRHGLPGKAEAEALLKEQRLDSSRHFEGE
ncbi:MAG: tetratricopeptide repeat protein [Verrucomicrobia bacterium]|nr:tetratricopeptide repeat protein [Verrucomicrobiota bacterium]